MLLRDKTEKRKHEAEMRKKIKEVSVQIINDLGYERVSMRKIAAVLGCSATHIYNYYEDKAEIIRSIVEDIYNEVMRVTVERVEASGKEDKPFEEQFNILVETFIKTMTKEPEPVKAVLQSGFNIFLDSSDEAADAAQQLKRFLKYGEESGDFKAYTDDMPQNVLISILGLVSHIVNNDVRDKKQINTLIENYTSYLYYGVAKRG